MAPTVPLGVPGRSATVSAHDEQVASKGKIMPGTVRVDIDDGVGWLIFDHTERHNAMTLDMWRAVPPAVAELGERDDVHVVVLRGAGQRSFVSGADISQFADTGPGQGSGYDQATQDALAAIEQCPKPTAAMIFGHCIGGGLALALAADVRYSADGGRFGLPPARLGIGYSAAGLGRLVDLVGPAVAKELVYTAEWYDAETALRWGLVNHVRPASELEAWVTDQARIMASRAPLTQRAAKLAVDDHLRPADRRRPEEVGQAIAACFASADHAEGVAAFLEKRPPRFTGR